MFLRDDQWLQLAPLLLQNIYSGGSGAKDNRFFIEAILWRINHLRPWSELPAEYGDWHTHYVRFRRWNESGVWQDLVAALSDQPELAAEFRKMPRMELYTIFRRWQEYGEESIDKTRKKVCVPHQMVRNDATVPSVFRRVAGLVNAPHKRRCHVSISVPLRLLCAATAKCMHSALTCISPNQFEAEYALQVT